MTVRNSGIMLRNGMTLTFPRGFTNRTGLLGRGLANLCNLRIIKGTSIGVILRRLLSEGRTMGSRCCAVGVSSGLVGVDTTAPRNVFGNAQALLSVLGSGRAPCLLRTISVQSCPSLTCHKRVVSVTHGFATPRGLGGLISVFTSCGLGILRFRFYSSRT